jgi:hypothetical protein
MRRAEQSRFVLATSSTLSHEKLPKNRNAAETRFINPEGKLVTVRAFGGEDDMADFRFVADDPVMLNMASLETAQMPGGPALKCRTANGDLSILIMSPDDHAVIEVEGAFEACVMAVVDTMEGKPTTEAAVICQQRARGSIETGARSIQTSLGRAGGSDQT